MKYKIASLFLLVTQVCLATWTCWQDHYPDPWGGGYGGEVTSETTGSGMTLRYEGYSLVENYNWSGNWSWYWQIIGTNGDQGQDSGYNGDYAYAEVQTAYPNVDFQYRAWAYANLIDGQANADGEQ